MSKDSAFGTIALFWFLTAAFVFWLLLGTERDNQALTCHLDALHSIMLDPKQTIKYMDEYDFYIYSVDGEVRFTAKTLEELLDQIGETE